MNLAIVNMLLGSGGSSPSVVAPTTQTTGLVASDVTAFAFTVDFTKGNGDGRLVVYSDSPITDMPIDGVVYLAGQEVGTDNFVADVGDIDTVDLTELTVNTTYYIRVFEYNGSGTSIVYNVDAATGNPLEQATLASSYPPELIAFYKLDETSGALVDLANNYAGTNVGASPLATGYGDGGTAYAFTGSEHIDLSLALPDMVASSSFSITFWVKMTDATPSGSNKTLFCITDFSANTGVNFEVSQFLSGKLDVVFTNNASEKWRVRTTGAAFADGVYAHCGISFDGVGNAIIYINGVAVAQSYISSSDLNFGLDNTTTTLDMILGGRLGRNSVYSQGLIGSLDYIKLWNKALSAGEMVIEAAE